MYNISSLETACITCLPLTIIFRKSLSTAIIPDDWKLANVVRIFKKGDRKKPGNYQPISLASVVVKLLESLIRDVLMNHFTTNHLFVNEQHGFLPAQSCITQLLVAIEKWTEALDQGLPVDVIYLDFKKVFNSVPRQRLLSKLKGYGISGNLFAWIESFLKDRNQRF